MIVDNRITEYLHSLEKSRGELLDTIEKKAVEEGVPIIRSETAALLRSLTAALRPENILEIGTAVGYSALQMCQVMPLNCHITTIEKYEKRIPEAKENFKKAGEESRITFLEGDADMWFICTKTAQQLLPQERNISLTPKVYVQTENNIITQKL